MAKSADREPALTLPLAEPDPAPAPVSEDELFSASSIKLPLNYLDQVRGQTTLVAIVVRKPRKDEFFWVHPSPDYTLDTQLLVRKEERECFLVAPPLWAEIQQELTLCRLHVCYSRTGGLFVYPLRLPNPEGRSDLWAESSLEIAGLAKSQWVRQQVAPGGGCYAATVALGELAPPQWPDLSLDEILRLSFRKSRITSLDHPVLRSLRGET